MVLNLHIMLLVKLGLFTIFEGNFFFKSCRKPLFTVLWNLRVESTQFLGHFKWCPFLTNLADLFFIYLAGSAAVKSVTITDCEKGQTCQFVKGKTYDVTVTFEPCNLIYEIDWVR